MSLGSSLVSELERLASALQDDPGESARLSLPNIAERIARSIGVRADEVAILGLSTRWSHLFFLVPESLRHTGFIPLSNTSAVAARTVRESRPEIINNFQAVRHHPVLQGGKIGSEPSATIQKMISAPIQREGRTVGVIQISRKGDTPASSGPDFSSEDLSKVVAICKPLGKLVQRVTGE